MHNLLIAFNFYFESEILAGFHPWLASVEGLDLDL